MLCPNDYTVADKTHIAFRSLTLVLSKADMTVEVTILEWDYYSVLTFC